MPNLYFNAGFMSLLIDKGCDLNIIRNNTLLNNVKVLFIKKINQILSKYKLLIPNIRKIIYLAI